MERAGRRWLAYAAPPLGELRGRESGAHEGGWGSLVLSSLDDAPRSGAGRPGSSLCRHRTLGPRGTQLQRAWRLLRTELSGVLAGAPSLWGRTEAAGNSEFGVSWVPLCLSPLDTPAVLNLKGRVFPAGGRPRGSGGGGVRAAPWLRFRPASRLRLPPAQLESTLRKGLTGWTLGSAPFLLLPGSRAHEHCRAG